MDFHNIYEQGFARVAACTERLAIADPAANAEAVLRQARACHEEGVAVAVFPELCLTGYSIEDLLLQDAVLDGVEEALRTIVAASADLRPVLAVGAPLRARGRVFNCAVDRAPRPHPRRRAEVLPADYREFYERRQIAPGDDVRGEIAVRRASGPVRPGPAVRGRGRPRASWSTPRCARTCGCRSRRARRRRSPARPCC